MWTSDAIVENKEKQATLEPLLAALEHIAVKGNLLLLASDHAHRARIMKAMTELQLQHVPAAVNRDSQVFAEERV
jgi:hypothetical protein